MAQPLPVDDYEPPIVVELDDERHAKLDMSHLGRPEHRRYLAFEGPDGFVLLKPEPTDEELEARLLANTELWDRIQRDLADPSRLRPRPQRSR
jgi:hypothetical protein